MKYSQRDNLVNDLREMADFIEANGHKLPGGIGAPQVELGIWLYGNEHRVKDQMVQAARVFGTSSKEYSSYSLTLTKKFGTGLAKVAFNSSREAVCTKRVVSVTKEPKREYVDVPGEFVEREEIEWDCHPLLAPVE